MDDLDDGATNGAPDMDSGRQGHAAVAQEEPREDSAPVRRVRVRAPWAAAGVVTVAVLVAAVTLVVVRGSSNSGGSRQAIAASLAAQASSLAGVSPHLAAQLATASYKIEPSYAAQDALFQVALDNAPVQRVISGTGHAIYALAEDRNGTEVYAASEDGSLIGWDMTTGHELARTHLTFPIQALAADPDGPYLAGLDTTGNLLLWHTGATTLGKAVTIAPGGETTSNLSVIGLGFFGGGDRVYVAYSDGYVTTYNALTRALLNYGYVSDLANQQQIAFSSGTSLAAMSQATTPGGSAGGAVAYLATTDNRVLAINLETFKVSVALSSFLLPSNPTSIAVQPGTPTTIEVSGTSGVSTWDLGTGNELQDYPVSSLGAGFDVDGAVMVAQTSTGVALIGLPGLYSATAESTTAGVTGGSAGVQSGQLYGGAVQAMAVPTSDGTLVAAGAADGSISVINPAENRLRLPPAQGTTVLAFDQRGNLIMSGAVGGNRTSDLYSIHPASGYSSGSYTMVTTYNPASSWWPVSDEFFANEAVVGGGLLIAAGEDPFGHGVVLVWNEVTGRPVRELKLPGTSPLAVDVRYDPQLGLIVARDNSGQVDVWSVRSWRQVMQIALGTSTGNFDLSPDGQTVAAALLYGNSNATLSGQASKLALIDLRTHTLREKSLPSGFYRIAYAPDGKRLALGGDNVIRFVSPTGDAISGAPAIQLPGTLENMAYSPDGRQLAVALVDGRTAVYDTSTGQLAFPPLQGGQANQAVDVAWSPSGTLLAISLGQPSGQYLQVSTTAMWQVDPRAWAQQDCGLAGGNLTPALWQAYVGTSIPYTQSCAYSGDGSSSEGQGIDLRQLDWLGVTVPAQVCSGTGSVELHDGAATISTSKYGTVSIEAAPTPVYGRLSAGGPDVAALSVFCQTGGTAASQVGQGFVVYDGSKGYLRVIGILTSQHQTAADVHVPFLTKVVIQPGRIIGYEDWYTETNADCCPSGHATTTWVYQGGRFVPRNTHVTVG